MRKFAGLATLIILAGSPAFAEDTREVRRQLELRQDGRVIIDTFKGSVKVKTWNQPKIDIVATIAPDPSGENQAEKVRLTEVRIHGSSGLVEIESDYSEANEVHGSFLGMIFGGSGGTVPFVNYEISMPTGASLEIEDHKSDITVADLGGNLYLSTHKGTVRVTNLSGAARMETHKGDVRIDFAKVTRASRFETHKGEIEIRIPASAAFNVESEMDEDALFDSDFPLTVNRDDEEPVRGRINGGGPTISIESHKGTIRLLRK